MQISPGSKLLLTGAGGWLGTEVLETLLKTNGPERLQCSVVCLGSRERVLSLSDGTQLDVQKLEGFVPRASDTFTGIVHLGFLTRDKVASLGFDKYVSANIRITSNAVRVLETVRPEWVATVSSGAVFSDGKPGNLENDAERNPYGFTKRIEEELLTNAAQKVGANIAIGRLWGAIGGFMPINRNYAVSDFIMQALGTGEIRIHAQHEVFRRYCDASGFMEVLLACAQERPLTIFDSGGHLIELTELASRIATLTSSTPLPRIIAAGSSPDQYFPSATDFEDLAESLGRPQREFDDVLELTIRSHLEQASSLA